MPLSRHALALGVLCLSLSGFSQPTFANNLQELTRKAEQEDIKAQKNLAAAYYYGQGTAKNDRQAFYWTQHAAEQGDATSQNNLGMMYQQGRGVAPDQHQARQWYTKAATQGMAMAQNNLAVIYHAAKDEPRAAHWFTKAAQQGHPIAQLNLGIMYHNGQGFPQDDQRALHWYQQAAQQGQPMAQFQLANALFWQAAPDYPKAMQWYQQAAQQGHANAQAAVGFLHCLGEGTAQNLPQAYAWLTAAIAQGNPEHIPIHTLITAKLSPEALEQAKTLAAHYMERYQPQ